MNILEDIEGVSVDSTMDHVLLTFNRRGLSPTTRMTPEDAIRVGQLLIQKAHQVIELNRRFISDNN